MLWSIPARADTAANFDSARDPSDSNDAIACAHEDTIRRSLV
jgi:hypothetical protein